MKGRINEKECDTMSEFQSYLQKLLGHAPTGLEKKAFACFDPGAGDRQKRFSRYNSGQSFYINTDNDHYLYVSNHGNPMHCRLDMAAHHLYEPLCYRHDRGMLMLGITRPEQEEHLRTRFTNYYIYYQRADHESRQEQLQELPRDAAYIVLISDESPWESLCRACMENRAGAHITASTQRLFTTLEQGLLYFVPEHLHKDFKAAAGKLKQSPGIIGKTLNYPLINLENEDGLLEIPLSTLRILQQQLHLQQHQRKPVTDDSKKAHRQKLALKKDIHVMELIKAVEKENAEYPSKDYKPGNGIPDLRVHAFPMRGLSFHEKSAELHTLSAITDLQIRGRKVLALSYFIESSADSPFDLEPLISSVKKSAALFEVAIANSRVLPGKENRLLLFLISKETDKHVPESFQEAGDFICLLGDPNSVLAGSAYARAVGDRSVFTPPGVMSGTLAALSDVVKTCNDKKLLRSAEKIGSGGLMMALYKATRSGLGANIYSERKSPEAVFIYGEPQAAVLISLREKDLIDLARITSNYNVTSTTIGRVDAEKGIVINKQRRFP